MATTRQAEILSFLRKYEKQHGAAPSHREIAEQFRFKSRNAVISHLNLLEKKGLILRRARRARSLHVCGSETKGIPVFGDIQAGQPIEIIESAGEYLPIDPGFFKGKSLFGLKVKGNSMEGVGILPGDIAVLDSQREVNNGEIAAVRLSNTTTLKEFYRTDGTVVLKAANPMFEDIVLTADSDETCEVMGRLVGMVRQGVGK